MNTGFLSALFQLERRAKLVIAISADLILFAAALVGAYAYRIDNFGFIGNPTFWATAGFSALIGVGALYSAGFYKAVVRFISGGALGYVIRGALAAAIAGALASWALSEHLPRSVPLMQALIATVLVGGARFMLQLLYLRNLPNDRQRIIIYGAGSSGRQLLRALRSGVEYAPVAFIDDNHKLTNSIVDGLRVFDAKSLGGLIREYNAGVVLLAMPSISPKVRQEILRMLAEYPVHVKTIPGLADIVEGTAPAEQILEITHNDLLGREPVTADSALMRTNIEGKVVMVTGAGGSIGSEICRQVLSAAPKKLILFEMSEYALFTVEQQLRTVIEATESEVELVPLMGSVQNRYLIDMVIRRFGVHTLYHAAAYKHVPLVEHNIVEGVQNNVFGTRIVAEAAEAGGVESFILVSTDKAVRPTNVMGASKRMAELVCQAIANDTKRTRFSIVRFGNVMVSSGSVIPRFRAQIAEGGPVTVTHPKITRFFMTIPEAAQLVIQAGAMGRGGDVFLLDMGEPVKIVDLARQMIRLSGYQAVLSSDLKGGESAPKGSICIDFCGLRPGEKLYEELLVDANSAPTKHPRIMTASESYLPWAELEPLLSELQEACKRYDVVAVRRVLLRAPTGYAPNSEIVDLVAAETATTETPPDNIRWLAPKDSRGPANGRDVVGLN